MAKQRYVVNLGARFERGLVIDANARIPSGTRPQGYRAIRLRCDCGNEYVARPDKLVSGHVRSCGCLQAELASATGLQNHKHGLSRHQLYDTWWNMIARCEDPNDGHYPRWGGRGIRVCHDWHDLATFVEYIERQLGPRPDGHSLDRIDNDGHYEPGNVRWATASQQRGNQRRS